MRFFNLSALVGTCFLAGLATQDSSRLFPAHELGFRVDFDDWATYQPDEEAAWKILEGVEMTMEEALQTAEKFAITRHGAESVRIVSCELAWIGAAHPVYSIVLYASWFNENKEEQIHRKFITQIGTMSRGVKFWRRAERFPGTPIRGEVTELDSGILVHDVRLGDGEQVTRDSKVKVHFQMTTLDGQIVYETYAESRPQAFRLSNGPVPGFAEGLVGTRVGGKRKLVIPPDRAFGAEGGHDGVVRPHATVVFDVEVLGVTNE